MSKPTFPAFIFLENFCTGNGANFSSRLILVNIAVNPQLPIRRMKPRRYNVAVDVI